MADIIRKEKHSRPWVPLYSGLGVMTILTGLLLVIFIFFCGVALSAYLDRRMSPVDFLIGLTITLILTGIHFGFAITHRLTEIRYDNMIQHEEIARLLRPDPPVGK